MRDLAQVDSVCAVSVCIHYKTNTQKAKLKLSEFDLFFDVVILRATHTMT